MSAAVAFLTVDDMAGLPGLPSTVAGVHAYIDRHDWWVHNSQADNGLIRRREGKGGGFEYAASLLPEAAREAYLAKQTIPQADTEARNALWKSYRAASAEHKETANARANAVREVEKRASSGQTIKTARAAVAATTGCSITSLARWATAVRGVQGIDYPAVLVSIYSTVGAKKQPIDNAIVDLARGLYLRGERPAFAQVYREVCIAARANGWEVPLEKTLRRRVVSECNKDVVTATRAGGKALQATMPSQRRSVSSLAVMEAVNADYREHDLFVEFPDGTVTRPQVCMFQDLRSSMMLSWRIEQTANSTGVRLAAHDMVRRYGVPRKLTIDNGREFAGTTLTAGSKNRNRFKKKTKEIAKPDEFHGVFTNLGIEVHFAKPGHGQAKPIERGFGDFAKDVDKDPRFAGSYIGNNPLAKPHNYQGRKAPIPYALFETVLIDKVIEHNTRPGRRGRDYNGKSFLEVFEAGHSAAIKAGIVQIPTDSILDALLMASKPVKVKQTGEIRLLSTDYGSITLREHAGKTVIARYDPDDLARPIQIYDGFGAYICAADPVSAVEFYDSDAAREHARALKKFNRATREATEAERVMGIHKAAAIVAKSYDHQREEVREEYSNNVLPFFPSASTSIPAPAETPSTLQPVLPTPEAAQDEDDAERLACGLSKGLDWLERHQKITPSSSL